MDEVAPVPVRAVALKRIGPAGLCLVLGVPLQGAQLLSAVCKLAAAAIATATRLQPGAA